MSTRRPKVLLGARLALCLSPLVSAVLIFWLVARRPVQSAKPSLRARLLFDGVIDQQLGPQAPLPFWAQDLQPQLQHAPTRPRVCDPAPPRLSWDKPTETELRFAYLSDEKKLPYVGSPEWTDQFANGSRAFYNSLAVFPGASSRPVGKDRIVRNHGFLGVDLEGRQLWEPAVTPPPAHESPGGIEQALKNGGFYLNLSNALPLDRAVPDNRETVCRDVQFQVGSLPDASIVITFYNEPPSTLLRSVHSVLNTTPPPILREIILVDDHSNLTENLPGSPLYRYIDHLPKVKLIRQGERKGLVHARLAGARAASGSVLVVLDSHIEVNEGWLEPQLARVKEKPNAVVFPQILAINPETFEFDTHSGIGCKISFRWSMVEQSSLTAKVTDPAPIPSPSMAGGLFAANLDFFWHLGGYDEGFSMWGAENVEMGFRTWQCGGRLECLPCAKTYHIYRKKGHGYESPHDAIVRNRLRAARVWTDEFFAIARLFIVGKNPPEIGSLDKMLALKRRLKCKPFSWFLDTVDPGHDIQSTHSIEYHGELRSLHPQASRYCLDTMSHNSAGEEFDVFPCHGEGGTQNWIKLRERDLILPVANERLCLAANQKFVLCKEAKAKDAHWEVVVKERDSDAVQIKLVGRSECLGIAHADRIAVSISRCVEGDTRQLWSWKLFKAEPVEPLEFSEQYRQQQIRFAEG